MSHPLPLFPKNRTYWVLVYNHGGKPSVHPNLFHSIDDAKEKAEKTTRIITYDIFPVQLSHFFPAHKPLWF
jgi:hypothetical protein